MRSMSAFTICAMTTSGTSPIEWPWRDLRRTVKVIVTPLSEYAIVPTKSDTGDIGLEIYSPYSYTVDAFRTIQIRTDLLIKFPSGVTGRILPKSEVSPLHVIAETMPSNYEDVVEITIKNTIDKALSVQRGCKIARIVPQTYYQPEIYVKPIQPGMTIPPNLRLVPPPPYGHQHTVMTFPAEGQQQGTHQQGAHPDIHLPNLQLGNQDQGNCLNGSQQASLVPNPLGSAVVSLQDTPVQDSIPSVSTLLSSLVRSTAVTQQNDQEVVTVVSPLTHLPMQQR